MSSHENTKPSATSPILTEVSRKDQGDAHSVMYDIDTGEAHKAGDITLKFAPEVGKITVHAVTLYNKMQGRGTGTAVYRKLPHLELPNGQTVTEAGYKIEEAETQTIAGKALWDSLERNGHAARREDGTRELVARREP